MCCAASQCRAFLGAVREPLPNLDSPPPVCRNARGTPVRRDGVVQMAERRPSVGELLGVIAAVFVGALSVLTVLTKTWPPLAIWELFAGLILFFVMWAYYYFYVLDGSGEDRKSDAYRRYEDLRQSLESGGTFNLRYVEWLSWTLDKVDVFFGDAKRDDPSLLARRLGIQTIGPTWTAASYDKCLLLPEASLDDRRFWRLMFGVALLAEGFAFWRSIRAERRRAMISWFALTVTAVVTAVGAAAATAVDAPVDFAFLAIVFAIAVAANFAVAVAVFRAGTGSGAGILALACAGQRDKADHCPRPARPVWSVARAAVQRDGRVAPDGR